MKPPYLMATIYVFAGLAHLIRPKVYMRLMPSYLPAHRALVLLSGVAEIVAGLLLAYPDTRALGAWAIIAILIAVFPANVHMLRTREKLWPRIPVWALWLRLPLQALLIYWAYLYTGEVL